MKHCGTQRLESFFDISDLPDNIFKPNLPMIEEYVLKSNN